MKKATVIFLLLLGFSFVFLGGLKADENSSKAGDDIISGEENEQDKEADKKVIAELYKDDPDYQKMLEAEKKADAAKAKYEAEKKRLKEESDKAKAEYDALKKKFKDKIKDDPKYKEMKMKEKELEKKAHEERLQNDPEYRKEWEAKQEKIKEYNKKRYEQKKAVEKLLEGTAEFNDMAAEKDKLQAVESELKDVLKKLGNNFLEMTDEEIAQAKVMITELKAKVAVAEEAYQKAKDAFDDLVNAELMKIRDKEETTEE